jgi:predicted DNA repair protein MutK
MSATFAAQLAEVAALSQRAAVQTLGVVGDDTAIACNLLIGGQSHRKLPMVWQVFKGAVKNKAILIPTALGLTFTLPQMIVPMLAAGGALLCYDAMEKIVHRKMKAPKPEANEAHAQDHAGWEKQHIKHAIRTDLLLSAEITTVSLLTVAGAPFLIQLGTLAATALAMTVGVYATVAGVIKLDDLGDTMAAKKGDSLFSKTARKAGEGLVRIAPKLIKAIGVLGSAAMFVVGGTMLVHGIPGADHIATAALGYLSSNTLVQGAASLALHGGVGLIAGVATQPVGKAVKPYLRSAVAFVKKTLEKARPAKAAKPVIARPAPALLPANDSFAKIPDLKTALNHAADKPQATAAAMPAAKTQAVKPPPAP